MTETKPTSEGLRRYQELCVAPAPPEALNGTWYDHAEWVTANVDQEAILQLYVRLWEDLGAEHESVKPAIYSVCDVVWHAMSSETQERCDQLIGKKDLVEQLRAGLQPGDKSG